MLALAVAWALPHQPLIKTVFQAGLIWHLLNCSHFPNDPKVYQEKKNLTGHPLPGTDKSAVHSEGVQQDRSSFDSVSGYLWVQVWSQCLA